MSRYDEYVESNYTPSMLCSEIDELRILNKKFKKENEVLKIENERLNEYADTLTEQDKDTCGELEAYRNENFELKVKIKEMKKMFSRDKVYKIICKLMKNSEQCNNCEEMGQKLSECKCMSDSDCAVHFLDLWETVNK